MGGPSSHSGSKYIKLQVASSSSLCREILVTSGQEDDSEIDKNDKHVTQE